MPQVIAQVTVPYAALVDADKRFALKLFHQMVTNAPAQNILSAPTALFLDFALLQNGADTTASKQMSDVFGWQALSPAQINKQSAALRQALVYSWPPTPKNRAGQQTGEQLIMAGSLWIKSPGAFRHEFIEINKMSFKFTLAAMPANNSLAARKINEWAARQTGTGFDGFFNPASSRDFVLADTTWFKGSWVQPFLASDTHPGDFALLSGAKKSVPMMPKSGKQRYLKGPKFQAVGLDYWNAEMYVFLPDEDSSLADFEQSLTPDNWAAWMQEFDSRAGYLELPRFHSEYRGDTKLVLQGLGMDHPFESFHSLASVVANPAGAKLTRVLSIVLLSVDEKGTEVITAASASGVVGGVGPAQPPPPPPFRMIVNRPFFFAICDRKTKAMLYMGAIVEP